MRLKRTTTTTLITDRLRILDDFQTTRQLIDDTHESSNRVTAALHRLRVYGAIDAMEVDGQLYWYLTPDTDTRIRTVPEKAEETKPRKPRARRKK